MIAAVRAELTKLATLPGLWLLTAALLAVHLVSLLASYGLYADAVAGIGADGMIEIFQGERLPAVPEMTEQLVAAVFTTVPLVPVAGALVAGAEFRSGQIGLSLAAVPSRPRLVVAKAVATAVYPVLLCAVLAAVTTAVMYPAVSSWRPGILVDGDVLRGYLAVTLVAVCATQLALGITLLTRRALAGILVMAVLLGATITQVLAAVAPALDAALPVSAARNLLFRDSAGISPPLTSGPAVATAVLLLWAGVALVAPALVLGRRDAR